MKLKYEFAFQPVGDIVLGVTVGDDEKKFNGMLQLDDVSYDIVSHMIKDTTREQIIDEMLEIYNADRDTIAESVDSVIAYLNDNGVLEIED